MSSRPTQLEEKGGDRVNARGCSRRAGSYVCEQLRQGDRTVLNRVRRTWRLRAEGRNGVCNICTPGCHVRRGGSGGGDGLKVNLERRSNVLRGRGDVSVAGVVNGWHSRLGTGLGVSRFTGLSPCTVAQIPTRQRIFASQNLRKHEGLVTTQKRIASSTTSLPHGPPSHGT